MKSDRLFGIACSVLAFLFVVLAVPSITGSWQQGEEARYFTVGPRLFPYIAGTLTLIFAVLIAIRPDGRNQIAALGDPAARRRVGFTVGLSVAYVALLEPLGFIVASVLALLAFFVGFGERRWHVSLPIALGVPFAVSAVFAKLFQISLPAGVFSLPI